MRMRPKILLAVSIVTISAAGVLLLKSTRPTPTPSVPQRAENKSMQERPKQTVYSVPSRIKIPKLHVDAATSLVGLTKSGDMETPTDAWTVGWYKSGARPGNNGTAVMAGHYGRWKDGGGSVFDNLHKLGKGDSVYITDENQETANFVVRELRTYKPDQVDQTVFNFSSDGKSYLHLITCQGVWNEGQGGYSDRLVVFAERV